MTRALFLLHRYLGIAVGVLMTMWCLSGFVMMYVSYPALDPPQRLAHLAPILWRGCCRLPAAALADTDTVGAFEVEMLAGRPVLDLGTRPEAAGLIDLTTGAPVGRVSAPQAASVAAAYGDAASAPRLLNLLDYDQWTLEGIPAGSHPLYHFALDDAQRTELYVSSSNGRAVQLTTRAARFWNWLGPVPHWLYFANLRHRARLWSQVVIYTSLLGCFLTAIGLYIGVRQVLRRPAGRWSPYRGFNLWHHMAGLVFGLFTLTWVLSGLLSMNPWGLLEGGGARAERAQLRGSAVSGAEVKAALAALAAAHPGGIVSIQSAPLHGRLYLIASSAGGRRWRLNADGAPAPLNEAERAFMAATLGGSATVPGSGATALGGSATVPGGSATVPGSNATVPGSGATARGSTSAGDGDAEGGSATAAGGTRASAMNHPASLQLLTRGDDYYFSHHGSKVSLPVYRLVLAGGSGTRYYVDPLSGELLARFDRGERDYRWWHEALHRMDFAALIRGRPQWDVLMWLLLSGVTAVSVTGTYLGYRRLTR